MTLDKPLTQNELAILRVIRELKPYERIEVTKDKDGKWDTYLVHRSQKYVLKPKRLQS